MFAFFFVQWLISFVLEFLILIFRCPMVSLSVRNVIMEMSIEERSIAPLPSISNRVPVFHIFGSLPTGQFLTSLFCLAIC